MSSEIARSGAEQSLEPATGAVQADGEDGRGAAERTRGLGDRELLPGHKRQHFAIGGA